MSINSILSIAQTGIQANQYAINVVSNNMANVNTEGYAKQSVVFQEMGNYNPVYTANGLKNAGAGVRIADIRTYRDTQLDDTYRDKNSDSNRDNLVSTYGSYIEELFASDIDGGGLTGALNDFYKAAEDLSAHPADLTFRANYIEKAQNVANTFNSVYNSAKSYVTSLVGDFSDYGSVEKSQASLMVNDINEKLTTLSKLNLDMTVGGDVSSLQSREAAVLDELSALMPLDIRHNENGTVDISIDGKSLVKGGQQTASLKYSVSEDGNSFVLSLVDMKGETIKGSENINSSIQSGQLGGILSICTPNAGETFSISNVLNKLDTMANEFASSINSIQTYNDGTTAAFAVGLDNVLVKVPETDVIYHNGAGTTTNIGAGNISVNLDILNNPCKVATARTEINDSGESVEPLAVGNNKNVLEIIETRDEGIPGLGNMSPIKYYQNMMTDIGSKVASAHSSADISSALADSVNTQRNSVMGVNVDEELVNLIKYQRAYEASARVLSTANTLFQTLINLGT